MNQSTLFIGNLTTIDYAYIHPTRYTIKGGSLNLSVEVTGNIEPVENVVVDFGTIKKKIKSLIDDKEEGFDHKIWVPENHGGVEDFEIWVKSGTSNKKRIAMFPFGDGRMVVSTPKFTLACPENAIRVCKYDNNMTDASIKEYLEEKLAIEYPDSNIRVSVYLTDRPELPYSNQPGYETPFTYVHGLKNSTSWGCQNIAHGHKSWLLFVDGYGQVVHLPDEFRLKIEDYLDSHMFIWRDNIITDDDVGLKVGYETPRGAFYLIIDRASFKIHMLDTETTVEHLAEWFVTFFEEDVKKMWESGATAVYFSEGLVKGARVSLRERFGDVSI